MIPDVQVDRVARSDGGADLVVSLAPVQPDAPDTWRVNLSDGPFAAFDPSDARNVRLVDGRWTDEGPAPAPADPSVHPDVKGSCATYVRVARDVLSAIPRAACVDVRFECTRTGDRDEVSAVVTFMADGDMSRGLPVHVAETVLDHVPGVRFLERTAVDFAAAFGIEGHDDASGVNGDFYMRISVDGMRISYEEPDSGTTLVLDSCMSDGEWEHSLTLRGAEFPADGMETLRRLGDDQVAFASLFEHVPEDNPMAVLLGIGLQTQALVLDLHREDEASGGVTFMLQTGMLR